MRRRRATLAAAVAAVALVTAGCPPGQSRTYDPGADAAGQLAAAAERAAAGGKRVLAIVGGDW